MSSGSGFREPFAGAFEQFHGAHLAGIVASFGEELPAGHRELYARVAGYFASPDPLRRRAVLREAVAPLAAWMSELRGYQHRAGHGAFASALSVAVDRLDFTMRGAGRAGAVLGDAATRELRWLLQATGRLEEPGEWLADELLADRRVRSWDRLLTGIASSRAGWSIDRERNVYWIAGEVLDQVEAMLGLVRVDTTINESRFARIRGSLVAAPPGLVAAVTAVVDAPGDEWRREIAVLLDSFPVDTPTQIHAEHGSLRDRVASGSLDDINDELDGLRRRRSDAGPGVPRWETHAAAIATSDYVRRERTSVANTRAGRRHAVTHCPFKTLSMRTCRPDRWAEASMPTTRRRQPAKADLSRLALTDTARAQPAMSRVSAARIATARLAYRYKVARSSATSPKVFGECASSTGVV